MYINNNIGHFYCGLEEISMTMFTAFWRQYKVVLFLPWFGDRAMGLGMSKSLEHVPYKMSLNVIYPHCEVLFHPSMEISFVLMPL